MPQSTQEESVQLQDRVQALVEGVIQSTPMYIVEVLVRGPRGARSVDIFLDADEGLDVDTLARVSREVEFLLDSSEVIEGRYKLNVSSPGVDRPLVLPRQFRKNVGRDVRVEVRQDDGSRTLQGRLAAADDQGIELALSEKETTRLVYDEIVTARIQLPW